MTATILVYATPGFKDSWLVNEKLNELVRDLEDDGALEVTVSWSNEVHIGQTLFVYVKELGLEKNIVRDVKDCSDSKSAVLADAGIVRGSKVHFIGFWVPGERHLVESYMNDYRSRDIRLLHYGSLL